MTTKTTTTNTNQRVIVKVLQDVLRGGPFASYSDLAEALKGRCARLRIPYDSAAVSNAIDQVERGGKCPVITITRPRSAPEPDDADPNVFLISREEAARIYAALAARLRRGAR